MQFCFAALAALSLAVALAFLSPNPAAAIDLQAARSGGLVGETLSGFVAPVTSPSGEVSKLVADINSARRAEYIKLAKRNNLRVEEIAALAAHRIIDSLPSGAYFQASSGGWRRK
jgi:uncharacterized protein YdbL (DUF1318 family)